MENTNCKNCGGDKGIHHYQTMQCPVGGRENLRGNTEYMTFTFEPIVEVQNSANDTAMPFICDTYISGGLTKRELLAAMAMQGLVSYSYELDALQTAVIATAYADALLSELAK